VRFEVDVSDIPLDSFYRDERCGRLEKILQERADYAEYTVKRYRIEDEPEMDPYYIINPQDTYMMWLNEWEIDALDDSEMLSYIMVTIETSEKENPVDNVLMVASLFAALFLSFILLWAIIPEFRTYSFYPILALSSLLLMVISGGLAYRANRGYSQRKRESDIVTMKQNPLFLQAIRKFASLIDISDSKRDEYVTRVQEIEMFLSDANS
jgi:hypothetical protein